MASQALAAESQTLQRQFCGAAGSAQQCWADSGELPAGNRSTKIDCTCSEGNSEFLQQESQISEAKHPLSLSKMLLQRQIKPHSILPDVSLLKCWKQQCWVLVAADAAQLWWQQAQIWDLHICPEWRSCAVLSQGDLSAVTQGSWLQQERLLELSFPGRDNTKEKCHEDHMMCEEKLVDW